LSLTWKGNL